MYRKTVTTNLNDRVVEAPAEESLPKRGSGKTPYLGKNFKPGFKMSDRAPRPQPNYPGRLPPFKTNGPPKPLPRDPDEKMETRDDPIWADAIFAKDVSVRENEPRKTVNVNLASQAPLTEKVADVLYAKEPNLGKQMPREAFRYYSTALTWMRIVETKVNSSQLLTEEERHFRELYTKQNYAVPEPLALFLQSFGKVTTSNGEKYDPAFPPLPTAAIGNHGGYYDENVYNEDNHNLYEEIPCLGIAAEACRQSASAAGPGHYQPAISPHQDLRANKNLLGYAPLVERRQEAKNLFLSLGITGDDFPETIPNTAINLSLVDAVSQIICNTSAFNVSVISISSFSVNGNRAMLLPSHPLDLWNDVNVPYSNSNFQTHSLCKEAPSTYGVASVMLLQMWKEPRPYGVQPNNAWLGFNYTADNPAPIGMIENRNARRSKATDSNGMPERFNTHVFSAISLNAQTRRSDMVRSLEK